MAAPARLILAALSVLLSGAALAQSAWEQAKELAGPNYRPPDLPTPGMQCVTCGSRGAPQSAPQTTRSAPASSTRSTPMLPPGATMGMAIFGSLLQQALNPGIDAGPDPAEIARQEEARRQAEAEAKRRAAEEEARHRALMASLKAVPLPAPAAPGTGNALGLKALSTLDAPQSSEALRETAGLGWDAPDLRFAVRHRPLAVSDALPVHAPQTVCDASGCRWQRAGTAVAPRFKQGPTRVHRPEGQALVDLLAAGQKPQANPRDVAMARLLELPPPEKDARLFAQLRRLWDKGRQTLLAIIWAWGGLFIDEYVPGGKQLMLMKDVYELADQSLSDAVKAAGWLGSAEIDSPPEIVSVEEAAQPFLWRGVTENKAVAEEIQKGVTVVTEGLSLGKRLMEIWEVR
ncbi:MAG: hypothetical protein HXY29_10415 [Rhodocyclaceae bacterium]|jgi:hypothetical protein|nr:hypothetical protein [Rhodocyclaceae bacterium]